MRKNNLKSFSLLGTLLTAALLMRAINRKQYHNTTLEHLALLRKTDSLRCGYYTDLGNKWIIEQVLEEWITQSERNVPIDLSQQQLVTLSYEQYLCVADMINLKGCCLRSDSVTKLNALEKCQVKVEL